MTYPQPPYGQQPQGYPGQQAPNYAPQPGYPAPGTAYAPPPVQYPPQGQPPYPPQGQPPQPEVRGTLKDFMDQPSTGGGPSLSFPHPGTSYTGTVVRNVTDADIQAQTDMLTGAVATYNDRRPKLVMKVPLLLHTPHPAYPEGIGVWYVKGSDRAELARAMEAAGAEPGAPQAGDVITITYTHDQPGRRGMNPTKIKRVDYLKGNGVPPQLPQQSQAYGQAPAPQAQLQGVYTNQQYPAPVQGPASLPAYGGVPNTPQGYGQPQPPQFPQGYPQQLQVQQYQGSNGNPVIPQIGQPVPPTAPAAAAPYATSAPPMTPPAPGYAQASPGFTPAGAALPPSTAQPTAPASPSSAAPGGPPPNWPADVPFIPGLTPEQARIAATMGHPAAAGQ